MYTFSMNKPQTITLREWVELSMLPVVQQTFDLSAIPDLNEIKVTIYGAKFIAVIHGTEDSYVTTYTLMTNTGASLMLEAFDGTIKQVGV